MPYSAMRQIMICKLLFSKLGVKIIEHLFLLTFFNEITTKKVTMSSKRNMPIKLSIRRVARVKTR